MRLSDLQCKDVVNIIDGKKIGNITDALVDECSGRIIKLVVEPNKAFSRFFTVKDDFVVWWEQIIKIGEDVILVDLSRNQTLLLK